jgi:hypothetical protein
MKKIFSIISIMLCFGSLSFAQFTKGKVLAGGSFSTNFNTYNIAGISYKQTSVDFFPQAGYFIMNNMAVGAGLSLGYSKLKSPPGSITSTVTSTSFRFSPFARYYIHNFFGQATFGLGTQTPVNSSFELKNSSWAVSAGYAYLLNEHVAIEPQIGYETNYLKQGSGSRTTNGNLFLKVGIQVYLGK